MSEENQIPTENKFPIILHQQQMLALEDKLKLADAAAEKEGKRNHRGAGIALGLLIAGCPGTIAVSAALQAVPHVGMLGSLAAALPYIHLFTFSGGALYWGRKSNKCPHAHEAYRLKEEFKRQQKEAIARLQSHAKAMIDDKFHQGGHLAVREDIALPCDDGSQKIIRIQRVTRGNECIEGDKLVSVTLVTARLHDAVREEATGRLIAGEPVADIPELKRTYQEDLRL